MTKKIYSLLLVALISFLSVGCETSTTQEIQTENQKKSEAYVEKISKDPSYHAIPFPFAVYPVYYKQRMAPKIKDKKPKQNSKVSIRYVGKLVDGTIFDNASYVEDVMNTDPNYVPKQKPIAMEIMAVRPNMQVQGSVIMGMQVALQYMSIGEKGTVVIPWQLAYGDRGISDIPARSALIFDLELVDILRE
ncbi:FKBP-type peptidyl-prolyl cis-trans isomerase [Porphyromonas canoris]|uniref:FKBP-type peptidyl-prolyl cis-trans isomerase n=1 Tax=Porphyromonas canoris TaxID=36875 RepID=UPI00068F36DD|nr:FKBP-type peptidyl-prolyl cis-trans isomerase [Porphyromonas canoris]